MAARGTVANNPATTDHQIQQLLERIRQLETRVSSGEATAAGSSTVGYTLSLDADGNVVADGLPVDSDGNVVLAEFSALIQPGADGNLLCPTL